MSAYRTATISRKAAKYRPAGNERFATVVSGSDGAVGRPSAGLAGSLGVGAVGALDAVDALDALSTSGRLPDFQDGRPGEGSDDAGCDLEVDRGLPQPRDGAVQAAGGHDRHADGEGVLHRLS